MADGSPSLSLSAIDWQKTIRDTLIAAVAAAAIAGLDSLMQYLEVWKESKLIDVALYTFATGLLAGLRRYIVDTRTVRMILVGFVLAITSLGGVASAEHVAILVDGTKAGSYIVTIDALGGVDVHPLSKVIVIDGPTPPPPPPPPDPVTLTERAKAIRDLAKDVKGDPQRAETAKGLAVLYREIAKLVRQPGQVKDVPSLVNAVSTATNTFLSSRPMSAALAWGPVRDLFGLQWTALTAANKPLAEYAVLLDECASGLDASAPSLRGISPEMLAFILEIIKIILALLKPV